MEGNQVTQQGITNHYQYNGKELNTDFGLDWLDYGARWYDASIGRFSVIDRFAEKYYELGNYHYAANNPMLFIDVNGDSLRVSDVDLYRQDMENTYGENQNYVSVSEDGNVSLTLEGAQKLAELAVTDPNSPLAHSLKGLAKVISEEEITEIVYSNEMVRDHNGQLVTGHHISSGNTKTGIRASDTGGEFTVTTYDNQNACQNTIYIDPAANSTQVVKELKSEITPMEAIAGDIYVETVYKHPRHSRVMHGIGHVIYKRHSEQSRVVEYDNYNRILSGDPQNSDPDGSHKDEPDPK